jgi:hypothetical protein
MRPTCLVIRELPFPIGAKPGTQGVALAVIRPRPIAEAAMARQADSSGAPEGRSRSDFKAYTVNR